MKLSLLPLAFSIGVSAKALRTVKRQAPETMMTATAAKSCVVASSAPSIAPIKVGYAENSTADGIHDTSPNASITSINSTIFEYSIPRNFGGDKVLCALEFRLPFCSELEKGYPCFHFSGTEQEMLSNSGMIFSLLKDDGGMTWNDTELHQVYPGDANVFGTFECGAATVSYKGDRRVSWLVSSVRNFALEFLQAGIGPDAQFKDGVGAFIVPCL